MIVTYLPLTEHSYIASNSQCIGLCLILSSMVQTAVTNLLGYSCSRGHSSMWYVDLDRWCTTTSKHLPWVFGSECVSFAASEVSRLGETLTIVPPLPARGSEVVPLDFRSSLMLCRVRMISGSKWFIIMIVGNIDRPPRFRRSTGWH